MILSHLQKLRNRYLFLLPLYNLIVLELLILAHWMTGKLGYLYSIFFLFLGLTLIYVSFLTIMKLRFNTSAIGQLLGLAFSFWMVYSDIKFIIITLVNDGFYPCDIGASCP